MMASVRPSGSPFIAFYDMQESGQCVYSFSLKGRPAPTQGVSVSIYRLLRYAGEGTVGVFFFPEGASRTHTGRKKKHMGNKKE
jgi:hypothetical protein